MFSKIHHIGYAVNSIEKAKYIFSEISDIEIISEKILDVERGINIQFLKSNDYLIELVESIGERSPISNILKKGFPTPYHICYEVDSIENSISQLKKLKFKQISEHKEAIAIKNRKVAFFISKELGLIELIEK